MSMDILVDQTQDIDPYKFYLDYGLSHAALSVEASLGVTPDTPVKVTIPLPRSADV